MQAVKVGPSKSPLCYFEEVRVFQLLQIRPDAALPCSDILCQLLLTGKTGVIAPGILQQHGVGELRADAQILVGQNEVGNLGEAVARRRIGTNDFDVAGDLRQARGDVLLRRALSIRFADSAKLGCQHTNGIVRRLGWCPGLAVRLDTDLAGPAAAPTCAAWPRAACAFRGSASRVRKSADPWR